MRKRRLRQAAKIDDIGAVAPHFVGTRKQRIDRQRRRINYLAEDADVLTGKIGRLRAASEKLRQIDEFIGTAREADAEFLRE